MFLEAVDAPLAFRLLNGANLIEWQPNAENQEFDKLVERVTELLGQSAPVATPSTVVKTTSTSNQTTKEYVAKFFKSRLVRGGLGTVILSGYSPSPMSEDASTRTRSRSPKTAT